MDKPVNIPEEIKACPALADEIEQCFAKIDELLETLEIMMALEDDDAEKKQS